MTVAINLGKLLPIDYCNATVIKFLFLFVETRNINLFTNIVFIFNLLYE